MNPEFLRASGRIVDRFGLPDALEAFYASLIPADCRTPHAYLGRVVLRPTHESLVPFIGDKEQLILRLAAYAMLPLERIKYPLNEDWHEELVSEALTALVKCADYINEETRTILGYVDKAVERAVALRLDRLKAAVEVPVYRKTPRVYAEPKPERSIPELYSLLYGAVRDDFQRAILELRWQYEPGLSLGLSTYCEDIARELNVPVGLIVEELELIQRRYLKVVNKLRRARNNPEHPALRAIPIHRIYKPHSSMRPYEVVPEREAIDDTAEIYTLTEKETA